MIRTPWQAVAAMFLLNGALFGAWASRIPAFAARFGLDTGELGLLLLGLALGAILSFPLAGALSDRFGAAHITRLVAVFYGIALVLLPLSFSPPMLGGLLLIFGATHGAMDVAMNGWGAEVERALGKPVMTSLHAMFSLGAGLGAGSGALAAGFGLPPLFHFAGLSLGLGALTLYWASSGPAMAKAAAQPGQTGPFALPHGRLILVGLVAFCSSLGEGAMADWSAVLLTGLAKASPAQSALGYTVFSAAMVAARLVGDRVVARLGPVPTARLFGAISTLGALLVLVGQALVPALFGFSLMGIGFSVIVPLALSRAANDPKTPPGRAIAGVATLGYGGMLIGPPAIGFLAGVTSLGTGFGLIAVLSALIVGLGGSLRR